MIVRKDEIKVEKAVRGSRGACLVGIGLQRNEHHPAILEALETVSLATSI